MSDQLTAGFSGKGYQKNLNDLMAMLEKFKRCCDSWITQVFTQNSPSITFSGLGTQASPLTAVVSISAASGNTIALNPDGLFSSTSSIVFPITGANDGLSVAGTTVKLGQTVEQAGSPASLTESREIPLNGHSLSILAIGEGEGGSVLAFNDGSDDLMYSIVDNNSFMRYRMDNTNSGDSAGAGFLFTNDISHIGWCFNASSTNAFVNDGLTFFTNGAGGFTFTATEGAIKFGNGLTNPLTISEYARFTLTGHLLIGTQ